MQKFLLTIFLVCLVTATSGCFGGDPKQSGVFQTTDAGTSWKASPDLLDKNTKKPKVYPPLEATAIAVSPADPKFVVAGTDEKLYRSTDAGGKWELLTNKLPVPRKSITAHTIRFDANSPGTYYVGGVSAGYGKIFKTTDRGDTFQDIFTVSRPGQTITSVLVLSGNSSVIIAGDQLGSIYRSADGGSSWRRVFTAASPITTIAAVPSGIFVGTDGSGVLKSTDQGTSFVNSEALGAGQRTVWAISGGPGGVYAGTDNGLLVSRDGGGVWQNVSNPLPPGPARVQAIAANDQHVFFAVNAVVYRINPNGESFVPVQLKGARSVFGLSLSLADQSRVYAAANNSATNFADRFGLGLGGLKLFPGQSR